MKQRTLMLSVAVGALTLAGVVVYATIPEEHAPWFDRHRLDRVKSTSKPAGPGCPAERMTAPP